MKTLRSLLLCDFRNVAHILSLLLLLHILRIGGLLGWFGLPARTLEYNGSVILGLVDSFFFIGILLLSLFVVLNQTSPLSKGAFMATRPISLTQRIFSRVLMLFLVYWLPLVLTDLLILILIKQPVHLIWPAVADTAVWNGVWLAALIPAFWLWRTRKEKVLGYIAIPAGFILASLALVLAFWHELVWSHFEEFFFILRATRIRIAVVVALGGLLFWGLLFRVAYRGLGALWLRLLMAGGITAFCALILYLYPRSFQDTDNIVEIDPTAVGLADNRLEVYFLGNNVSQDWKVDALKINGQDISFWKQPILQPSTPQLYSNFLVKNLSHEFGSEYTLTRYANGRFLNRTFEIIKGAEFEAGAAVPLELSLHGRSKEWEQVAELPLQSGAQDGNWTFVEVDTESQKKDLSVGVHLRQVRKFLGEKNLAYMFALVDEEKKLVSLGNPSYSSTKSLAGATSWIGFNLSFDKTTQPTAGQGRLLIYQQKDAGALTASWRGQVVALSNHSEGNTPNLSSDKKAKDINAWMEKNPAPMMDVSRQILSRYLAGLLGEILNLQEPLPKDHAAIQWMAKLVKHRDEGVELLLSGRKALGYDQGYTKTAIETALVSGFSRQDMTRLLHIFPVVEEAASRGWLGDVEPAIRNDVNFCHPNHLNLIMKMDDRWGYTNKQLLDLFLHIPRVYIYRILEKDTELKAMMDRQIREWFDGLISSVDQRTATPGFPVKLALEAGFPDAPARIQKVCKFVNYSKKHRVEEHSFEKLLDEYFETSGWPTSAKGEHFMQLNPKQFVFDPEIKKYREKGSAK